MEHISWDKRQIQTENGPNYIYSSKTNDYSALIKTNIWDNTLKYVSIDVYPTANHPYSVRLFKELPRTNIDIAMKVANEMLNDYLSTHNRSVQKTSDVYAIVIVNPKTYDIIGISSVFDSYDLAAAHLEECFMNGFIECTGVQDMYLNGDGELLVIEKHHLHTEEDYC